jgi:Cdc6-like AAA superfamily ATPase
VDITKKFAKLSAVSDVFRPRVPVTVKDLFAGRFEQLRDLMNTALQPGQHAVVFGERGVGKTSLVNVAYQLLGDQVNKPACGAINCDATMDFSALWHKAFREMSMDAHQTLDSLLPKSVTPDDVRHVVQNISKSVFVFDEVDQIKDKKAANLLAATIKNLSDHSIDTTIVLVGVADSVDSLIAEHASIERALLQIPMPRMSDTELYQIIDTGLKRLNVNISTNAKTRIARLSQGLPHFTHLLSFHATQHAIERGDNDSPTIDEKDVSVAITRSLKQAQQSVIGLYDKATSSANKNNLYEQVLLACALAKNDERGYFYAGAVREPMSKIMGRPYDIPAFSPHMSAFCEPKRGPVLVRDGTPKNYRFRFKDPLVQPYVIMRGLDAELISASDMFG